MNNKEGLLDKNGIQLLEPSYERIGMFYNGIATAKNNFKFGYINNKGKEIVPLVYDLTFDNHNELLIVRTNQKVGLLNSKGTVLFEPAYKMIRPYGNFVIVMLDKKQALYTRDGKQLLGFDYDGIDEVNDDSMVVVRNDKASWLMDVYSKKQLSKKFGYL